MAIIVLITFTSCSSNLVEVSKDIDFAKHFESYTGTFKLYDLTGKIYITYNDQNFKKQDTPASTFKILHSLIALQTGVLKDENTMKKWDGKNRFYESHNMDHTLKTAVRDSVVWYFQDTARQIGIDKMQDYLNKTGYGNKTIGPHIDMFWIDGSLKISVDEQLNFVTQLYREELPFDSKVIKTVKNIIVNEEGKSYTLSGKTGTSDAPPEKTRVAWYVGYITTKNKPYTFVTKIEGSPEVVGWKAKEITIGILRELNLME